MSLINEFIRDYKQKVEHYEQLAQICAHQCESELKRRGLRALVTHRAKRLDSLMNKALSRSRTKRYQTIEEIYADILDLAGVRIALFFPGDQEEVDAFVRDYFQVEQVKDFPEDSNRRILYSKRFSGYAARHYRVRLKGENLSCSENPFTEDLIELQVGSVLMHAWAEVEHDLVYKSTSSKLSQDEYAILDELNGLMHAGEIALERLQRAVKRRLNQELTPFSNHYELSSFLYDYLRLNYPQHDCHPAVGRTDILFQFLYLAGLDSVAELEPILSRCDLKTEEPALAQQITDLILLENPDFYQLYNEARIRVGRIDSFGAGQETLSFFSKNQKLGWFMHRWIAAEQKMGPFLNASAQAPNSRFGALDREEAERLEQIKLLRNEILYGERFPSEEELAEAGEFLAKLTRLKKEALNLEHFDFY